MIGPYDGAEICELVGSFTLYQLSFIYSKSSIGLFRYNGLAVFKNRSGPQAENSKKHFQNMFRKSNLHIIIKYNLKIVAYLVATPLRWFAQTFS